MLFDQLVSFYQSIHWEMAQVPNETILSTTYGGKNGQWVFVASSDEPHGVITLFARFPESCPAEKYAVMTDFLNRANFGMTHGAWVMDRNDGEIRYRVGIDMSGLELTNTCLKNMTLHTNLTMERYLPGLYAVIQDGKSAKAAYDIIFS